VELQRHRQRDEEARNQARWTWLQRIACP